MIAVFVLSLVVAVAQVHGHIDLYLSESEVMKLMGNWE